LGAAKKSAKIDVYFCKTILQNKHLKKLFLAIHKSDNVALFFIFYSEV